MNGGRTIQYFRLEQGALQGDSSVFFYFVFQNFIP